VASTYYIDLEQFSLERFQHVLETGRLLPSEAILREGLAEHFAALASNGIRNLADLTSALRTKKKLERFAEASGVPIAYLTVLRRRAGSYTPRPIPLKKLIGVDPGTIDRLAALGVKDTKQLFERARRKADRDELARRAGLSDGEILELVKLSDLARPPYVGPAFARLLHETGVDTLAKLSHESPEGLRAKLVATKARTGTYRAAIPGIDDMVSWLEAVRELPQSIEY
jgi:hypothetical protein